MDARSMEVLNDVTVMRGLYLFRDMAKTIQAFGRCNNLLHCPARPRSLPRFDCIGEMQICLLISARPAAKQLPQQARY